MKKGILYMIPCPIGDTHPPYDVLPIKNRDIIQNLDYFIVENTRSARRFLSRAEVGKPIDTLKFAELNEHTKPQELEELLKPILSGSDAGMISEAGLPGVADPGADIAALCHRHGIRVVPMVGPSSMMLALMASGQNGQSFAFNGYLPIKPPERKKAIRSFEKRALTENQAQLFIEAPYRNVKLFEEFIATMLDETRLTVAADILEPSEYIKTLSIREWRKVQKPDLHKRPAIFIIGK